MSKKKIISSKSKSYNSLVANIANIVDSSQKKVAIQVNSTLIEAYWNIGLRIVEYEQGGKEKAEYGSNLLKKLSKDLTIRLGKGFSVDNLGNMRKFYLIYNFRKSETLSRKLSSKNLTNKKYETLSRKLSSKNLTNKKSETASRKLGSSLSNTSYINLSWSHFIRLMNIKDNQERSFYEIECTENNWSVRELDRQINSCLFERLSLSKNKIEVKNLAEKGQIIENPTDSLKQPYFLEFLGLEEKSFYSENDLETAIINNLQKFLLELGKGFTFAARQKRVNSKTTNFYIDLVFYNRLLKCFLLIDLKIGKITHQDIGQMQMYVNYYDREIKTKDENPTIGLVLCKEKDDFVIEYTLPQDNKQIFAKEYKLYLPKKEELHKLLDKYL